MGLTQTDREMLPEWIVCGQKSYDCFCWLEENRESDFQTGEKTIRAYERGIFRFLYGKEGKKKRIYGIYNTATYGLTDVSRDLYEMLEFPESLAFRDRKGAERTVAKHVSGWLAYYLEHRESLFHALGREVIPKIDRSFIERQAAIFFLNGARAEDIRYVPEFHFGEDTQPFTMELYLLWLQKGAAVEQAIARQWIRRRGIEIFQQKVIYGCIRNEFDDIMNRPRHRLHKEKERLQRQKNE